MKTTSYRALGGAAKRHGMILRGGFAIQSQDPVPASGNGRRARSLVLVGNAGPAMWHEFKASQEFADGGPHPLNRWTRRVVDALAADFGAWALYPFDGPPYLPFIEWAKRCEAVAESPLGILIHPEYGLWHAYRAALAFGIEVESPGRPAVPRPCDSCELRPCLGTCPVDAFDAVRFFAERCARHIGSPQGSDCVSRGCRARRACPVGVEHRYAEEQSEFHTRAFLEARRAPPAC